MRLSTPAPNGWEGLPFGATTPPYSAIHPHRGQDWGWYYGRPVESKMVYSNCTGVVTAVHDGYGTGRDQNQGWGNGVEIQITRSVVSKLWHFNKGAIEVRVGQTVTPETFIGYMGNSGWTNGGTHLHEELWIDGVRVDPSYYRSNDIPGTGSSADSGDSKPFTALPTYLLGEEDMANPIAYYKGDKAPNVYALYLTAGAANDAAKSQGGVYFARRSVGTVELAVAVRAGYKVETMKQADLDSIPKVYGSR